VRKPGRVGLDRAAAAGLWVAASTAVGLSAS
jgi:hypothetical protein